MTPDTRPERDPVEPAEARASDSPSEAVLAHVLFIDIVGSSKLASDEQRQIVNRLQQIVGETTEYQRARSQDKLTSLPTGDGMALVFSDTLEAPADCAVEIARVLRKDQFCKIRMGIHSGPVFMMKDINGNRNVSGAGINRAERVMSCGAGDHIIVSDNAADSLRQLSRWKGRIHDAGMCQVKDGWLHIWNLYDGEVGNPASPRKSKQVLRRQRFIAAGAIVLTGAAAGIIAMRPNHLGPNQPLAEHSLNYSLIVKPPNGPARPLAREMLFPPGYRVKFNFTSATAGFLYLANEGPLTEKGQLWTWLFPDQNHSGGAALQANQAFVLPEIGDGFVLDSLQGKELVYVIWSEKALPELERIKAAVFGRDTAGQLTPEEATVLRRLIDKYAANVGLDKGETSTTVRGKTPVLVQAITLEHM